MTADTRTALVSADWLQEHLDDEKVVVIEIDNGTTNYTSGHIPGAVKFDWQGELQDQIVRDIVDKDTFEKLMSTNGISNDDTLVFYSGQSNWWAAVGFWYARMYGHADIRLLDGGRAKWVADGRPLSTEVPKRSETSYVAKEFDSSSRVDRNDVLAAIDKKAIVDVRSPGEYTGELIAARGMSQDHPHRRGHVPSAINIPWTETVNADETFKSPAEIAEVYRKHGVDLSDGAIVYCRIGWRSSHSLFALKELVGAEGVLNYDASWNEYGMLSGAPIVKTHTG